MIRVRGVRVCTISLHLTAPSPPIFTPLPAGPRGRGRELLTGGQRTGYLLKRRVSAVDDFVDAVTRIAAGGSVVDPAIVQELVSARRVEDPLAVLTTREREVLALMAEGRSNAGIAASLWLAEGTVEKHVGSIMSKLDLSENSEDHRRVLAVITFLDAH